MSCDVSEVTERLEIELSCISLISISSAHSPTFLSLLLRHNSFSNPSVALPTSQLILQPFRCFTYVTAHSPTIQLLHLRHSSSSNSSFASPTSQALHLASRPCGIRLPVKKNTVHQNRPWETGRQGVRYGIQQLIHWHYRTLRFMTAWT